MQIENPGSRKPERNCGPSFLFIGTGRAGSTWFFEVLREHPEVFMPPNKGTFFFTKLYDSGIDWYEAFFPPNRTEKAAGESCEDYLSCPEALARIKAYRPEMRLICCLRNPYERALSAWHFFDRNGMACPTLSAQGECRQDLFYMGYYARHLEAARRLFPQNQLLVFLFEELAAVPEQVVQKLYSFVGVDPTFVPPSLRRIINPSGKPRSRLLARVVHNVHMRSWGSSRVGSNLVGTIKQIRPVRNLVKALLYRERPAIEDWVYHLTEFPAEVIVRYEQEITALENMLGQDLSHWHAPSDLVHVEAKQSGELGDRRETLLSRPHVPVIRP